MSGSEYRTRKAIPDGPLGQYWLEMDTLAKGERTYTRPALLETVQHIHSMNALQLNMFMGSMPTDTDRRLIGCWHDWAEAGLQSVQMPDTYAAGLLATDVSNVLKDVKLPWPAFEIRIPEKLLYSGHGEVQYIWVWRFPENARFTDEGGEPHTICVCYQDEFSWGSRTFRNAEHLGADEYGIDLDELLPALAETYDHDKEQRLWRLMTRLVGGVILAINEARVDKPGAFPQLPLRMKHGKAKPNTQQLGRPLKIDCRPEVRNYMLGTRGERMVTVSTFVRGHWRMQAYGPQWSLHRRRWIEPHRRGDGPLVVRPVHLGGKPDVPEP